MLNKTLLKKALILTSFASLFIVGCSSDQNYKREVDGNDSYLKSPELKPLVVPKGMVIPPQTDEYYIYPSKAEGELGKNVDIRPPLLPIPTMADAYASYDNGVVTLDAPQNSGVWEIIPATLSSKNIIIQSQDNNTIKTTSTSILRGDEQQAAEGTFLIKRHTASGREYITVELTDLRRMGQPVSSKADTQRYVVGLFNEFMNAAAPASAHVPPSNADKADTTTDSSEK